MTAITSLTPLTIAGSDPTGGAGLEADLKVFLAHGLSGAALSTALTIQDTHGVRATGALSPSAFRRRLDVLLDDVEIAGAKTGLLPSAAMIRALCSALEAAPGCRPLVVDPVLAPTRGAPFLDRHGRRLLLDRLLPLARVVTPNLAELALLLGQSPAQVKRAPERATELLLATGVQAVLLTGGHARGPQARDLLNDAGRITEFTLPRISGTAARAHGTGCALSAALLSRLLLSDSLEQAVRSAKRYVHGAIRGAVAIGRGRPQLRFAAAQKSGGR